MGLDARRGAGFPPELYEAARMENQARAKQASPFCKPLEKAWEKWRLVIPSFG